MRNFPETIRVRLFHIIKALPRLKLSARHLGRRRLVIMFVVALALVGAIGGWWLSQPPPVVEPPPPPPAVEHVPVAPTFVGHAAPGQTVGCAACHTTALAGVTDEQCKDCHDDVDADKPLLTFDGDIGGGPIQLIHHNYDPDTPAPTSCDSCHTDMGGEGGDARFAMSPTTAPMHDFCTFACHSTIHMLTPDCPDDGLTTCGTDCAGGDICESATPDGTMTYAVGTCACV